MGSLVAWGYWGLFIGSFLASTIIPMSADLLLVGVLSLGGNTWICLIIATIGNWLGGLTSYWLGLARALVKSEARAIGETEGKD